MKRSVTFLNKTLSEQGWQGEINAILASKSRLSAVGQIFLASLAAYSLKDSELGDRGRVALWGLFVANAVRLVLQAFSRKEHIVSAQTWHLSYFAVTWVTSTFWATLTLTCLDRFDINDVRMLHILIIMSGVGAAASAGLSPHRLLARTFMLTALGPLIVKLALLGTTAHLITLSVLVAYMVFLFVQIGIQSGTILELFGRRDQARALFNASFEAIMIHENGRVLDVNRALETLFGRDRGGVVGGPLLTLIPEEDWDSTQRHLGVESDEPFICRGLRGDGEIFPMEVRTRSFYYEGRPVRLVCAQDISQRLHASASERARVHSERAMSELREKAALESSRMKSQFLANMSHEIRTPMNAIIAISDLLQNERLSGEGQRFVRTLRESSESLLSLINDILDYSKIESGHLTLEKTPFDIADLVESQTDLLTGRALQKRIGLRCYVDPRLPHSVVGDYGRLGQIIVNLVGNAIKFTQSGEVSVRCFRVDGPDGRFKSARFEVQDSGCGITEETGRRLFNPFVQADASTARRHGGTGLGLSICKNLVGLMGGEIGFDSDGLSWTTFWFEIPFRVEAEKTIGDTYRQKTWSNRSGVIIRDSFSNWQAVANYIRSWGLLVHEVEAESADSRLAEADLIVAGGAARERIPRAHLGKTIFIAAGLSEEESELPRSAALLPANVRISDLYNATVGIFSADGGAIEPVLSKKKQEEKELRFAGARVLIAEDNSTNQMVIMALLKRFGINGRVVANGEEAVTACREEHFDLVLMDCQMPDVDGWEATERIRREESSGGRGHVPIVALTANATKEDRQRCLDSGMDDFLSKPVRRMQLAAILKNYLNPSLVEKAS